MPLTYSDQTRILKKVILGVPAPDDESIEAAAWRKECYADVQEAYRQGYSPKVYFPSALNFKRAQVEAAAEYRG